MLEKDALQSILVSLIFGGICVFLLTKSYQINALIEYEEEFVKRHRDIIERHEHRSRLTGMEFLPLSFPHQETEHLLNLCTQPWSRWTPYYYENVKHLKTYTPSKQIHYLGFKTVLRVPKPLRIELIRCSEKYALIEAGDGVSGYVLEKFELPRKTRDELFHIYTKFFYTRDMKTARDEDFLAAWQALHSDGPLADDVTSARIHRERQTIRNRTRNQ